MNTTIENLEMDTDEAVISALTPKTLEEIELKPYSLMRQVIALDLGRTAGSHFFNAVVAVWVCTLEPLEALKAHENIPAAQLQAFEWAEAHGYSLTNYEPLLAAYGRLNRELAASTNARARGEQGPALKNDGERAV
jgi:hypothetical protein